ncbi:partial putative signaling protein, partial [Methylophilaceae bacterium]
LTAVYLSVKLPLRHEDGSIYALCGISTDITERKDIEEHMRHMAQYDGLTHLPNRALFSDRLQQALAAAKRERNHLALMFLDLDKFKPINDTYGHAVGDLLLKEAAQRIQDCLRASDTAARIGGDEFVVLLPIIEAEQDAGMVGEKIRNALIQPFELAGHTLHISSSIGVAVYPQHGADEKLLVKSADIAMYHAKKNGRDNVKLYQPGMQEIIQ